MIFLAPKTPPKNCKSITFSVSLYIPSHPELIVQSYHHALSLSEAAMAKSSANSLLPFLLALLILSQEIQAAHHSSPAPEPAAHQPGHSLPMYGATPGSLHPQECAGRCGGRCSATAYKKPCMFFCQKCCATCLCVPPGTYGNKQFCPCYNNWKTQRGGPKCP